MNIESMIAFKRLKKWFLRKTPSSGVRRVQPIFSALASDIGIGREENQDRVALVRSFDFNGDPYTLALISDGMGGMKDGGVCAATTMAAFLASFFVRSKRQGRIGEWLSNAALDANRVVFDMYSGRGGATLSVLLLRNDGNGGILNIGDTRVYGCDGASLMQLTIDDTIAGQLGDKVGSLKGRNELLQFVGMGKDLDPHYLSFMSSGLKSFVLTTDGVHYLDKGLMRDVVVNAEDVGVSVRRLVEVAKWCGGRDNCSSIIVSIESAWDPISLDDLDGGLCEIWDSFGDLQLYQVEGSSEEYLNVKKHAFGRVFELAELSSLPEKKISKDKKIGTSRARKGVGNSRRSEAPKGGGSEEVIKDDSAKTKENNIPQLKMSFPSKE